MMLRIDFDMPDGTVKWFDPASGHGLIRPDDGGPDLHVEAEAVERSRIGEIRKGQRIGFDYRIDATGVVGASNLRRISEHSKFKKGDSVDFVDSDPSRPRGRYKIVREVPSEAGEPYYRVRCEGEPHERMAAERELRHVRKSFDSRRDGSR